MIQYLLFLAFPLGVYSQECTSISSVCSEYEEVEYVLVGIGGTTAVVSKANIPYDLGLSNAEDSWEDDNGNKFNMYYHDCFRIIYGELLDGRFASTISRL
mgnify:CR=1 FL=1